MRKLIVQSKSTLGICLSLPCLETSPTKITIRHASPWAAHHRSVKSICGAQRSIKSTVLSMEQCTNGAARTASVLEATKTAAEVNSTTHRKIAKAPAASLGSIALSASHTPTTITRATSSAAERAELSTSFGRSVLRTTSGTPTALLLGEFSGTVFSCSSESAEESIIRSSDAPLGGREVGRLEVALADLNSCMINRNVSSEIC